MSFDPTRYNSPSDDYTITIEPELKSGWSSNVTSGPSTPTSKFEFDLKELPTPPRSYPASIAESTARIVKQPPRPPKKSLLRRASDWIHEWTPFMLVFSYFVFSTCIYMVCTDAMIAAFWFFYMTTNFYIAGSTVLEAFMSIIPCRDARKAVTKLTVDNYIFPTPDDQLPFIDLIIVAYLPNEKDIIMDQALYALEKIVYPRNKIRINVVYNTPKPIEPLETELFELEKRYAHARVIKVPKSKSKADNLNYFFTLETGDVIAIYDCDHFPHPFSPRWAAERFCQDSAVQIVQGRCVVYNSNDSILTQLVTVEFDKIYAVSHPGRAVMMGFALFCGSNGYWKASTIKQLEMDESMLTEDIDSALRAFTIGAKCVHELNVVSYEQAPTNFHAFWKQRLRWAQGWTQASVKHLKLAWNKSPEGAFNSNRDFYQRFGIFSLLFIREWSYYLVTQYTCLVAGFVITKFPRNPEALIKLIFFEYPISMWLFFVSIICLIATLWITNQVKNEFVSRWMIVQFSALYPIYLVLMATIGLYGHAREVVKYNNWNPTARG